MTNAFSSTHFNVEPFVPPTPAVYTGKLYCARGGNGTNSNLYTIDVDTGILTSIGSIGFAITGLAYDTVNHIMYGATNNNSAAHPRSLVSINLSTGAGTYIGGFGNGSLSFSDIATDASGNLFGWISNQGTLDSVGLCSINKSTGVPTFIGYDSSPSGGGIDFGLDGYIWRSTYADNDLVERISSITGLVIDGQGSTDSIITGSIVTALSIDKATNHIWMLFNTFGGHGYVSTQPLATYNPSGANRHGGLGHVTLASKLQSVSYPVLMDALCWVGAGPDPPPIYHEPPGASRGTPKAVFHGPYFSTVAGT